MSRHRDVCSQPDSGTSTPAANTGFEQIVCAVCVKKRLMGCRTPAVAPDRKLVGVCVVWGLHTPFRRYHLQFVLV